jgi:putative adenylate-forming enzyme
LTFQYFNIFQPIRGHWQELLRLKPNIIVAQPSVILELIKESGLDDIPWRIEKIISVAEVLTPKDEHIISNWAGIKVDQVYQCTEGFLAHTCSNGNLHWNSDFILVEKEWLNENQYIPRITDLKRKTQPIVRYAMNDVITKGACSCSLKSEVIGAIDGRMDDVFKWETDGKTITIFPDFLRRTIAFSNPSIKDYQVVKKNQEIYLWILGAEESYEDAESSLMNLFLKKGIVTELFKVKQPRVASNGKKKRVINLD